MGTHFLPNDQGSDGVIGSSSSQCPAFRRHRFVLPVILLLTGLATAVASHLVSGADSVIATGPERETALEDRVEVQWTTDAAVSPTTTFHITRNETLIHVAASTESLFEDYSAVPDVPYTYCVIIVEADQSETEIGCDTGGRIIARPTGFTASDGLFEDRVLLSWSDRSEIEGGYNVYRTSGNALQMDGNDGWVKTAGIVDLTQSYTFEFWARRASIGTEDFVINLEVNPNGDPVDVDLEVGFLQDDRFVFGLGTNLLITPEDDAGVDWHHWAIAYDLTQRRRLIYRDGVRLATDVLPNLIQPTGDLEFGRRNKVGPTNKRGHFHGEIDDIRFWNFALTEEQVRARMSALMTGLEPGLVAYWPMDVASGASVPDFVGNHSGVLIAMDPPAWVPSGVPRFRAEIGADLTSYVDRTAVIGFMGYTYGIAAFEDVNGDHVYTLETDFESEERTDTGWRAFLTPPDEVSATDGQHNDKVVITWLDRSSAEEGYRVYRDGSPLGGDLPVDVTAFEDSTAAPEVEYEYCVVAFAGGFESIEGCDLGIAGVLPAPLDVTATHGVFDDRVTISWTDQSDTEDGFEIYRDSELLATVDADAEEFSDLSAAQGVEYDYCVQAFSKANPLDPAYSLPACAGSLGMRAIILDPTDVGASYNDFEDRVELAWANPSTTVMVFLVYRDDTLIEVLDFNFTAATDWEIPSDTDIEYCVSGATVVSSASTALQGQIAQVLQTIHMDDAVRVSLGGARTSPEAKLTAAYEVMGLSEMGKNMATAADGFYESNRVCETGSRSLVPPLDVSATDNEYESHVAVTWQDSSSVETGYIVFRQEGEGPRIPLDTLSADRATYEDYTGTSGVRYEYSVETFDDFGRSVLGSDRGRRTLESPSQLEASDGISEKVVELRWKDNSTAEKGYAILRRVLPDGAWTVVDSTGKNEPAYTDEVPYTPPNSLLGVRLEYSVLAFDDYGRSDSTYNEGFTTIESPANVNASEVYGDKIVVVWVDESDVEDGYEITRRNLTTQATDTFDRTPNTTSFSDTGIGADAYQYCARAWVTSVQGRVYSDKADTSCDEGEKFAGASDGGNGEVPPGGGPKRIINDALTSNEDGAVGYGTSVALRGTIGLIGAPGADPSGIADRYTIAGDNQWTRESPLTPATAEGDFGYAVGLGTAFAVVGDPLGGFGVFEADGWTSIISSSTAHGYSAAVTDLFVVVGDKDADGGRGSALVCKTTTDCSTAPRLETLLSPDTRETSAAFGTSVDITRDGDTLYAIVGAPGPNTERAYIFECSLETEDCTSQTHWSFVQDVASTWSEFGAAVSIDGRLAVIGAPAEGAIWIWERTGGDWSQAMKYRASEDDALEDYGLEAFGGAVDMHDNRIIVGAPDEKIDKIQKAGAVFVYDWDGDGPTLTLDERYDARTGGKLRSNARFGTSVAIYPDLYLVGAPGDADGGAAYAIPFGTVPSEEAVVDEGVDLVAPTDVAASDGTAPDRIQIRWSDEAEGEDGHLVYRSIEGGALDLLTEVAPNIEFFDDFSASPGEAYKYCVAAYSAATDEVVVTRIDTVSVCDVGWRPANGTIAGIAAAPEGGGTADAEICLSPSPNRAMLLDGVQSYVEVPVEHDLDKGKNFTIEAWIRRHNPGGDQYVVSKDSAWALSITGPGNLRFEAWEETHGLRSFVVAAGVEVGSWRHVAVRKGENSDYAVFLDGTLLETVDSDYLVKPQGELLTIGRGYPCTFSDPICDDESYRYFEGEIDEVRIWGIERTNEEISTSRFAMLKGDEEGLLGYWPLDEGRRRVVPDLTESANHGQLVDGIYLTDLGAPLQACATTGLDGNYSIQRIRYGTEQEFRVTATHESRRFEPSFRLITLTTESPVQNQVQFVDVTAFTVAGVVQYVDSLDSRVMQCPVPDIGIYASKGETVVRDEMKTATAADGSFELTADPSTDATDPWYIIPSFDEEGQSDLVHTFDPENARLVLLDDTFHVNFEDELRHRLSGYFSGGDPFACGKDIGAAKIRIWTQDGCYDRTVDVDSKVDAGRFEVLLPPLKYLVQVDTVMNAPTERQVEIGEFFRKLGAVEVDLTGGDAERNLIYRAPLALDIAGLSEPACGGRIVQKDEEGFDLRFLPQVPTIAEYGFVPLTISVVEDYGVAGTCLVEEGSVTIFDAIADRVDADSTMQLGEEPLVYTTFGASPNIFSGARIGGVDRSFQKPITVVAQVEGRQPITETKWAIVEGVRERSATFVSAITEPMPLYILYDPPGSTSYAFREKGTTTCNRFGLKGKVRAGIGLEAQVRFGAKADIIKGTPFAAISTKLGAGLHIEGRGIRGAEVEWGYGPWANKEVCLTNTQTLTTSADPGWVGEDIHVGVALNLIFAIADVLEFDACRINLSETLAADINEADPFETTYMYGRWHIEETLIPELENLIRLAGGDATLEGEIDGDTETVRLTQALRNWKRQLLDSDAEQEAALEKTHENVSFSGGTEFQYGKTADRTSVQHSLSIAYFTEGEFKIGPWWDINDAESFMYGVIVLDTETTFEWEQTGGTSENIGYVLGDEDAGDYFSVDVGEHGKYGTYVFQTVSGRSSNPWEENTQKRDNPIILVDPPVLYNVPPDEWGSFNLTLINASESNERRHYTMAVPGETNPGNLGITVTGDLLGGARLESFLLDPGKALTINMDVMNSASQLAYEDVAVVLYPEEEYQLWLGDTRQPFALADTAWFSVYFDSTGGNALASTMSEGWNWFSINRPAGSVESVMENYMASQGDLITYREAKSKYDSLAGWTGSLTELNPGTAYRLLAHEQRLFRMKGDPVDPTRPLQLDAGWNSIGYLPSKRMPVGEALASLDERLADGDAVVGQRSFAQYVSGVGWVGTLTDMEPGEAYDIFLTGGGELTYPEPPEKAKPRPPTSRESTVLGPEWKVNPGGFDTYMTLVAEIRKNQTPIEHTAMKVAATSDGEVRGVGDVRYVKELDQFLAFIQIYGAPDEDPNLRVHVYDGERDALYEDVGTVRFAARRMLGRAASPIRIDVDHAGQAPELLNLPESFALYANYPNPFNPTTTIAYELPESSRVRINVYDALGRLVRTLVDGEVQPGRHQVIFDAEGLASGFYMYRLKAGDFTQVHKMILVK